MRCHGPVPDTAPPRVLPGTPRRSQGLEVRRNSISFAAAGMPGLLHALPLPCAPRCRQRCEITHP